MAPRKTKQQASLDLETRLDQVIAPVIVAQETTTETPKPKKAKGVVSETKAPKTETPKAPKAPKEPKPGAVPIPRGIIEKPLDISVPNESTTLTFVVVCEQDGHRGVVRSLVIPCTAQVSPIDGSHYVWAHPKSAREGYVWNRADHRSNELIGWEFASLESAQKVGEWSDRVMLARQDLVSVLALDWTRTHALDVSGKSVNDEKSLENVFQWARNSPSLEPSKSWDSEVHKHVCPPGMRWNEVTSGCVTDEGKITAVVNSWALWLTSNKKEEIEALRATITDKINVLLTPWGVSTVDALYHYGMSIDVEITDKVKQGVNPWVDAILVAPVAVELAPEVTTTPEVKKPSKKPKRAA